MLSHARRRPGAPAVHGGALQSLAMRLGTERLILAAAMALSVLTLGLQAFVLRPHLYPAGADRALVGDTMIGALTAPQPVAVIRPPRIDTGAGDPSHVLRVWRDLQRLPPGAPIILDGQTIERPAIWAMDNPPWNAWLRLHLGPLAQMLAFLAGAAVLIALGAHGTTAMLMTLALIVTATANGGPLLGADEAIPVVGPLLLIFNWLITAFSFPIIGLAVLYFPHRSEILDRYKWIVPGVIATSMPMLVIGVVTATFLLGADAALPALSWIATHPWAFNAAFAIPLAVNVAIVIEGIQRYQRNPDADERRRIQIVVFTGVPAVFAYALKTGIPLLSGLMGRPAELPWMLEAILQLIVLLPAFGLPYAVAVRHVFSPRTVLRRSLQYALARRTLAAFVIVPIVALIAPLVQERNMTLQMIVSARPLFYLFFIAMLGLILKYRDPAQRWLDRKFFRSDYDAREILVSLAGRVPYEADPRDLVAMVVTQIDSALHPESIAVLAIDATASTPAGRFEPVASIRSEPAPLPADSGVITLLKWSDKPLEVFLDDEQSPVARVPPADRAWLASTHAALLVPIFAGGSDPRPMVGLVTLGHKKSEEPYTAEDRELLRGIAVQMGVALDLSRLRRQASSQASMVTGAPSDAFSTPTVIVGGTAPSTVSVGAIVDGKYRVDAILGQGGMGAVFKAWDVRLERPVAIKVVRADMIGDPESRARFRRESQIVARLQHPSIVTVFDYGALADGAAFLVMEYVPGNDLRHLLRREGRLDTDRVVTLMSGIASGVEVAHKSGIFHRDLKPENILLPEGDLGPKVVDFGVAKLTNTGSAESKTLSMAGTIVGTPAYMAPEQLRGEAVDARADVFSLGVMAYEMLTARLPYTGASLFDIGMKQAEGKVDASGLPPDLAGVIVASIAYEKDQRPPTAAAFAEALTSSASSRPRGDRSPR